MDIFAIPTTYRRVFTWAYCVILLDYVIMTSSSSLRQGVNAADVKPISESLQLQCPPCEKLHCSPRNVKRLRCKGGITRGVCNCCPVCAKLAGEPCGGQWNYLGRCDAGLTCIPTSSVRSLSPLLNSAHDKSRIHVPEGKCVQASPHHAGYRQNDQPVAAYCRPRCTPDYCTTHTRAVCSAVDNAEKTHSCHGECQHTSCRACHFVKDDVECGKCATDDFECIKSFGRCIKQDVCSRKKYPCRSTLVTPGLKFQCVVPKCLTP